jgi:hypothetical protein
MRIIDAPLTVLRLQYRIARFPLQLFEERVVARMGSEAPARLFYERSFGLLDTAVGNALGDRQLQKRGSALAERSDALGRAAGLDAAADQAQRRSSADLEARTDEALEEQQHARASKERKVANARTSAAQRKRQAQAGAAQRTAAAKKRADDVAGQRTKSAEAAKREAHDRIRSNEQEAVAAAKSKLDSAQARRTEADSKRAQADRIEELADAEKQKRQSERGNDK